MVMVVCSTKKTTKSKAELDNLLKLCEPRNQGLKRSIPLL